MNSRRTLCLYAAVALGLALLPGSGISQQKSLKSNWWNVDLRFEHS